VSGTQADTSTTNNIIVMKMSNLKRTFKVSEKIFPINILVKYELKKKNLNQKETQDDSEESDSDEDEDADEQPELEAALIKHNGCVNRIRVRRFL
jgi:hypothetical protein